MKEKDIMICDLKREVNHFKVSSKSRYIDSNHSTHSTHSNHSHSNLAVQNSIQRLERERDSMKNNNESLQIDNISLSSKLRILQESQVEEQNRYEHILNDYRNRINQIEGEKKDLLISQVKLHCITLY